MKRLRRLVGETKERIDVTTAKFTEGTKKKIRVHKKEDLRKHKKNPPVALSVVALAAILIATMYLYKAFMNIPVAAATNEMSQMGVAMLLMLFYFVMFVRFVISLFSTFSGNRKAWASTIRMCASYVGTAVLGATVLPMFFSDLVIWDIVIPQYAMVVFMLVAIALLFLPGVRKFFTPSYAKPASLGKWALFAAGVDPFGAKKLRV